GTGGTTTLATANALRCDEALLSRGVDLSPEFERLQEDLPISTAHEARWRPATRALFRTCDSLGLAPTLTPKLIDYNRCARCGRCVLGCPTGAKWDSRVYLGRALAEGARLSTRTTVERIVTEGEGNEARALGVIARRGGRRHFFGADLVVVAAGGFGTPAILARSGIQTEDRLFVDPVLCVAGPSPDARLAEEVPMPFYVQGDGYLISPYFDYLSFFFDPAWRRSRHDIATLMIKLADSEAGAVDGRLGPRKELSSRDRRRLAAASETCIEILAAFGVDRGSIFLGSLNAGHPGGTLPLSGCERRPLQADHLPRNLYVADASLLPEALGRPPILTIMALATRVARVCRERFA
ncbi:MAG: GMC family oxidoreductase N-terminal domain-containing protein, partial [Anaerolineae bacterium]